MKKILHARADIALFISRIIIAVIFISSGWAKVSDMPNTIKFMSSMHIPTFLTYIVSYGELVGGVLIGLGVWSCVASAFLSIIMAVAVYLMWPNGMMAFGFPLATLASTIAIFGAGPGKISVKFCGKSCCPACDANKTCVCSGPSTPEVK